MVEQVRFDESWPNTTTWYRTPWPVPACAPPPQTTTSRDPSCCFTLGIDATTWSIASHGAKAINCAADAAYNGTTGEHLTAHMRRMILEE